MAILKPTAKRTRNLEKTRTHILGVAFGEVYRNGFQGVSVNDIVEKTKLTKGAFFHHFPTKLDLGYALVDEVITGLIMSRWIDPLKDHKNPLQGMLKLIEKYVGAPSYEELQYGCPLNNLVQEMSTVDPIFKKKLQAALELWVSGVEKEIKRAQENKFVKKNLNAREIAEFIVMAHEGLFGTIKGFGNKKVYESLYKSLKIYTDAIAA